MIKINDSNNDQGKIMTINLNKENDHVVLQCRLHCIFSYWPHLSKSHEDINVQLKTFNM